jgi:cytochrome c biogenesis protein CcmG, thiol:disulfide interchange protein DsbE
MFRRLQLFVAFFAILIATAGLLGCGSPDGASLDGTHPNYAKALKGAPAPLAALYKKGGRLLPGGTEAFEDQLAELRGYPVVANVWASWCGPCRFEFPVLQELSARYGKRVAFLGINSEDSEDAAATFLREEPVPYPSYSDPHREIARSLDSKVGYPNTIFLDANGNVLYVKVGPYSHHSELHEDVRTYALRSG